MMQRGSIFRLGYITLQPLACHSPQSRASIQNHIIPAPKLGKAAMERNDKLNVEFFVEPAKVDASHGELVLFANGRPFSGAALGKEQESAPVASDLMDGNGVICAGESRVQYRICPIDFDLQPDRGGLCGVSGRKDAPGQCLPWLVRDIAQLKNGLLNIAAGKKVLPT